MRRFAAILWFSICGTSVALAGQAMTVVLQPPQGEGVAVADLELDADGGYRLRYRDAPFEPHFLSMRPFQCLPAPPKLQCHLPYPYASERRITADDLGNLEYDLLFLVKQAEEFGVDFWNGRYYRLRREGGTIVGDAYAVDMNILASKPPAGVTRPIGEADMTALEPADTPYPRIQIRPAGEQ